MDNLPSSFEDLSPSNGGSGWKKTAVIVSAAVGVLAVAGVLAWIFWPKAAPPSVSVNPPAALNQPQPPAGNTPAAPPAGNTPAAPPATNTPPSAASGASGTVQTAPAGIDRPITAEERQKYGFSQSDDIWVQTTSPTDGSQPQMFFYDKTVNPSPVPYVPPVPYQK
jgi:hypothetical protein